MIPDFDMEFDGIEYETVGYIDTGAQWEWDVTAILRRKADGALFIASGSGCSCNYFGDINPITKQVYSIEEALREVSPGERSLMKRSIETMKSVYA